jgi:hypothetical protein
MIFGAGKDDGKIRIRCPGCGKKLKFPGGRPGLILRCPICTQNIIAPLDGAETEEPPPPAEPPVTLGPTAPESEEATVEAAAAAPVAPPEAEAPVYPRRPLSPEAAAKARAWAPQVVRQPVNPSIERLVLFLTRENDRVRDAAVAVIHDPTVEAEQRDRRLSVLRQDKNVRVRNEIDKIVGELDEAIHDLTYRPAAAQGATQLQLRDKKAEKEGLLLFLRTIYGVRLADTQRSDAIPGE